MSDIESTFSIRNEDGGRIEIKVGLESYKAAAVKGISLNQYLSQQFKTDDTKYGTVLEQCMASAGLFVNPDASSGLRPPSMYDVLEGTSAQLGPISRNEGDNRTGVSGRLLFPAIILELVAANLLDNNNDLLAGYDKMIASTVNVNGTRVDQPTIDVTAPESSRAAQIAQLAEPNVMVSITLSEKAYNIPTKSIGLTISNEALAAVTIDEVGMAIAAQARGERLFMVQNDLSSMISGNSDRGETALSSVTAQSFDSAVVAAGTITHKALMKYLRANYRKMAINWLIMGIDEGLLVENRTGKPTVQSDNPTSPRIDTLMHVDNLLVTPPRILLVEQSVVGANTIVGLDSRYAIRRTVNVGASYQAIQEYVMRKATSMRFDFGETAKKLFPEAWSQMTMTV